MSKKIRVAQYVLVMIFIAIFIGILLMAVFQSKTVADVKTVKIGTVGSSDVELKWHGDSSVDGYFVYQNDSESDNFDKIADLSSTVCSYEVKELTQASDYKFYVTAYKQIKHEIIESEKYNIVEVKTLPAKQELDDAYSVDEGCLVVEWQANPRADGYYVEYSQNEDFEDFQHIDIDNAKETEKSIENLTVNEDYYVRACSYYKNGDKAVTGEWSEPAKVKIAERVYLSNNIDPDKPMIALTFDDGPPYSQSSERILDVLEKYNARATFFMVGTNAADHPDNLKRKVKLGCEIGNHTYTHQHYGKNVTTADVSKASDAIYKACGVRPTAFRSPGGNTTETIRNECKKEGMALYYWSIDTEDWKSRNADKVYSNVMKNVKDGDIILMHEIYGSTADAVEKLVPALIKKGYQLVTCQELIQAKTGKNPQPGQQYYNGTTINNNTK